MLLYATLGIPLLICTIACSGARLSRLGLNVFLCIRHYAYSLPIHYLCNSCGLRWLCYCFWCCCCYSNCDLCCCGPSDTKWTFSCCDTSTAVPHRPQLRLTNYKARKICANGGQETQQSASGKVTFMQPQEPTTTLHDNNPYSFGLFMTSLLTLMAYLALGARIYSKLEDKTFLDGLLISFSLISCTQLPNSFTAFLNPKPTSQVEQPQIGIVDDNTNESLSSMSLFLWHFFYLFVGLNLISVCVHIGLLCVKSRKGANMRQEVNEKIKTNGFIPNSHHNELPAIQELQDKLNKTNEHQLATLTTANPYFMNMARLDTSNQIAIQRQPQAQVDLTELFVAVDQSPAELHLSHSQTYQAKQQLSDLSFASTDRSTEHGSLCLHHQAQYNNHNHNHQHQHHHQSSSSPANSFNTLYASTKNGVYSSRQQVASGKLQHLAPTSGYQLSDNQHQARVSIPQANEKFEELEEETRFVDGSTMWHTETIPASYSSNHLSAQLINEAPVEATLMKPSECSATDSMLRTHHHSGVSTITRR